MSQLGADVAHLRDRLTPGADMLDQLTSGTSYAEAVHRLLAAVRTQLGMQMAWVSEFVGDAQVLRFVSARDGVQAPAEGVSMPLSGSFCARVLDGRFPSLIPDSRGVPEAALLDVTAELYIGSYVGVPLVGPQGAAVGMLCAISNEPTPGMSERDVASLQLMAQLLHDLQRRALSAAEAVAEQESMRARLFEVILGRGRQAVLQPIVDLSTGRAVAAEGLTRFSASSPVSPDVERTPAQWFDDASRLGLHPDLELAAAAAVLDLIDDGGVPGDVALCINLAPSTIMGGELPRLLDSRPLDRVVVEVTEHAPVVDYDGLASALRPFREGGMKLAVDDAGAGYASLRHVLAVQPDLIKIDMALTRGADSDLARRTLLTSLASFAEATGCRLVAEGVETQAELHSVASCGVHLAQGYFLARPSPSPTWSGYPSP